MTSTWLAVAHNMAHFIAGQLFPFFILTKRNLILQVPSTCQLASRSSKSYSLKPFKALPQRRLGHEGLLRTRITEEMQRGEIWKMFLTRRNFVEKANSAKTLLEVFIGTQAHLVFFLTSSSFLGLSSVPNRANLLIKEDAGRQTLERK